MGLWSMFADGLYGDTFNCDNATVEGEQTEVADSIEGQVHVHLFETQHDGGIDLLNNILGHGVGVLLRESHIA